MVVKNNLEQILKFENLFLFVSEVIFLESPNVVEPLKVFLLNCFKNYFFIQIDIVESCEVAS